MEIIPNLFVVDYYKDGVRRYRATFNTLEEALKFCGEHKSWATQNHTYAMRLYVFDTDYRMWELMSSIEGRMWKLRSSIEGE